MKKGYQKLGYLLVFLVIFSSCELLEGLEGETGITNEQVVEGLKTALNVGTDSSVVSLNAADGYYADAAVKIFLPDEAKVIYDFASYIGGQSVIEDLVKKINRSAEDAAIEAKPIFVSAVTDLTITQGLEILQGVNVTAKNGRDEFDSLAATHYLEYKTRTKLKDLFKPKINTSLGKPLIAGISANSAWSTVMGNYNKFANTLAGQIAGATPVTSDLPEYTTDKALNGLFVKIGVQERKIRKDPFQWALDILEKVFGSVYQES